MTLITKNVTTLTELKTLVNQGGKAAVIYDASAGTAFGLDLEVLINMDASIADMDASVGQVWTMAQDIADDTVAEVEALIEEYVLDASTSAYEAQAAAAAFPTTHPETALYSRWLADTGTRFDVDMAIQAFEKLKASDPATVAVWMPRAASKVRTSGVNRYMNKMYSLKSAAYDAAQADAAVQPFVDGYIAPSEKLGLKFMQGQTQTGLMDFADKAYLATDSWTFTDTFKVNKKGSARKMIGASAYIAYEAGTIILHNGTVAVLTGTYSIECGKTPIIEFQYNNATGLINVNNIPIATTVISGAVTFGQISYNSTYPIDGTQYYAHLQDGQKSAAQSASDYTVLRSFFPEVETIGIGYQRWTTSNYNGTVAGDGTVVNEVQGATTDGNTEKATNGTFDTDLSGWNNTSGIASWDAGAISINTPSSVYIWRLMLIEKGRAYRVTYTVTSYTSGDIRLYIGGNVTGTKMAAGTYTEYIVCGSASTNAGINIPGQFTGKVDNLSIKEVGASDSTLVYNYVYAATSGTAAVKDLAATKAAAGWCYYDNLPANGAVYGKLYNGYAVHLLDLYPPMRGLRIPTSADYTQLSTALGGDTVSGGKLKAKFGGFDNSFATNESGFSATPAGRVGTDGTFAQLGVGSNIWSSNYLVFANYSTNAQTLYVDLNSAKQAMRSLRFLANSPNVPDTCEIQTNWITTNFASGTANVDLAIPFGCVVDFVRVTSKTGITSMQGVLYTGAGSAKETLFSGATVVADTPIELNTRVNQSIQQVNGFVRFNGVKADTGGLMMIVIGLKKAYNTEMI